MGGSVDVASLAIATKADPAQMNALWTAVKRLIGFWAYRYIATSETRLYDVDDLIQSGFLALVDAVRGFDPESGEFVPYLKLHIRNRFAEVSGRRGSKHRLELYAVSLDAPISDEGDTTRLDMLADPHDDIADVDQREWLEALHTQLDISLDALPDDGGQLLRAQYYDGKGPGMIAEERGIDKDAVKRAAVKAMRTMRRPAYCNRLQPFIEEITNYHRHVGLNRYKSTGLSAVEELAIQRERIAGLTAS